MTKDEHKIAAALSPFGWTCTDEFWQRYYADPWVFDLANAVERLSAQQPPLVSTAVTYCVTHDATDHDGKKWTDCRFRQLFYFENPADEDIVLWADRLAAQSDPMGWLNEHLGSHVWRNGAELVWECADECPHPDHDDDHASVTWEPSEDAGGVA
jgi:hypothetical protein